jgi:hypothetical protein
MQTDTIQTIGIIGSIFIGVIASLLVIWQIKAQAKQTNSSTDAMITAQVDEINRLLFEYPEVFPGLEEPYPTAGLGKTGDRRYHLMHLIFNNFEQVFLQARHYRYVDSHRWNDWNTRIMTAILKKPYAIGHWDAMGWQYPEEFRKFIEGKRDDLLGTTSNESNSALALEILKQRFENHRQYVSRQWQYFAAFILLNGLLVSAVKDLDKLNASAVKALGLAFVTTSAVFFHLILWTNLRIHRNAARITELAAQDLIEIPKGHEGITPWLLVSVFAFTVCWLVWLFAISWTVSLVGSLLFILIVGMSVRASRKDRGLK